jgi:hypothetical protein
MTDRQLMQRALDALVIAEVDGNCDYEATELLRTRLAHCDRCGKKLGGEGDIHTCSPDPIGDAQDRLIAELAAQPEQEPVGDEWTPCMKLPVVVHVRKQRHGESHVSTREGITPVKPDDLIMRGVSGEEYPIGRAIFEQTYTLDTTPPAAAHMTEFEEAVAACDNTLHHAIDHWQNRALKAEAKLAQPDRSYAAADVLEAHTRGYKLGMKQQPAPVQPEQEPVGFAGIEMWVGNARIKKLMTQKELHSAIDPWAIVKLNSDGCIDALKEKNT